MAYSLIKKGISTPTNTHDAENDSARSNNGFGIHTSPAGMRPVFHLHGLLEPGDVVRLSDPGVDQDFP